MNVIEYFSVDGSKDTFFSTISYNRCSFSGDNFQGFSGMDERGGGGTFGNQSGGQDGSANGTSANQGGISVPDFLPPAQRVLFMRIQQKQQEEEERARRMAEGGAEKSRDAEGRGKSSAPPLCKIYLLSEFSSFP